MKCIIISILFLLFPIIVISQNYGEPLIHQDLGTWSKKIDKNINIKLHGYVTKKYMNNSLINLKYEYNIMLISESKFNNQITDTWIYGTKIFINGNEKTKQMFPNGFVFYVTKDPIKLYQIKSNSENIHFEIKWNKSIIEPTLNH